MTLTAFLLVFISVFLHAGWNLLSKKHHPSGAFYLISSATAASLWAGFFLASPIPLTELPPRFPLLLAGSIASEAIYCLGLAYAYRISDISVAYPLGRALPVLMVTGVTLLLGIGSAPTPVALAGMGVIFAGCLLLPLRSWRDFHWRTYGSRAVRFILMIAAGTTGYTIFDSQAQEMLCRIDGGPRLVGTLAYLFLVESGIVVALGCYVALWPWERQEFRRLFLRSPYPFITGFFSSSAYALVLLAMNFVTNVSYIQAFRQMSLPLGALAGIVLLKEVPSRLKLAGIGLIIAGLLLVAC